MNQTNIFKKGKNLAQRNITDPPKLTRANFAKLDALL